jgi:hypothetical protein
MISLFITACMGGPKVSIDSSLVKVQLTDDLASVREARVLEALPTHVDAMARFSHSQLILSHSSKVRPHRFCYRD